MGENFVKYKAYKVDIKEQILLLYICYKELRKMVENIIQEKKPNLLLAILSAVGLGLIGAVLWGLLYYAGYIAWAAAYVTILLSAWGYKKIYKKLDVKGYIIIGVISIVEIIVAMLIALDLSVMIELAKEGFSISFGETFSLMFEVIGANAEIRNGLIVDIVLSLVCIAAGMITLYFIDRSTKKKQKPDNAENLNLEENSSAEQMDLGNLNSTNDEEDKK